MWRRSASARTAWPSGFRKGSAWFDLSTNAVDVVRALHAQLAEQGVAVPRCAGQRRPDRRQQRQAGDLGRRRQGGVRQVQTGARRDGRPGALYRPDRRRLDRQAGAQCGRRGGEHRAGRGVHHGREGRRRAAAAVGGDPPGRRRTRPTVRSHGRIISSPAATIQPDFALRLLHKDVSLACQLAREVGVPMRLTNLAHQELTEALNRGWAQRDFARVACCCSRSAPGSTPIAVSPDKLKAVLDADESNTEQQ